MKALSLSTMIFMTSIILISNHVMITEAFSLQTLKGFHTKLHSTKQQQVETNNNNYYYKPSPISMNLDELTQTMNGKGKAQLCWDCFKIGIDPLLFFHPNYPPQELDQTIYNLVSTPCIQSDILQYIPTKRQSITLGKKSLQELQECYLNPIGIESSIATLEQITQSKDGTTKLLLKLVGGEYYIESVIIPNEKWGKSTLCVSSQVGCAQGCVFCATGKMGRLASLGSDEILIQLYYANKVVRCLDGGGVGSSDGNDVNGDVDSVDGGWSELPTIDNIV